MKKKYLIPQNTNWSEAAYKRDLDYIPERNELKQKSQVPNRDPLFREVMYPLLRPDTIETQTGSKSQRSSESQSHLPSTSATQGSRLTSSNQPIPADSFTNAADRLAVDIADDNYDSIAPASFTSIASVAVELHRILSSSEVQDELFADLKEYLAPEVDFTKDPGAHYDKLDDSDCYEPAWDIEELRSRIQEIDNLDCVSLLRYLRIDWIRLRMRPKLPNGCYLNVERAATFVKRLIDYYGDHEHLVLKCIDQGWFVIKYLRNDVYKHQNTPAQTGRAVHAKEIAVETGDRGTVEYFNPLFLLQHLMIDQLLYVGNYCLNKKDTVKRKVKLLERLGILWKKGNKEQRKVIFDSIGQAFTYMTIKSPLSVMFRLISSQVLRNTKGTNHVTDHLSFSVLIADPKPWDIFMLCGPLPKRLDQETRVKHLESEPMLREETTISYPKTLRVHINGKLVTFPLFDDIGGTLYPRQITECLRIGGWNTFLLTFDLDEEMFQKGFVLHVVQGYFKAGKESQHKS